MASNNRRIIEQLKKYERLLSRLRSYAKDKAYLWDWVEEDQNFGPLIPAYLAGIWKDIAETQLKIRTLQSLLRLLRASRQSFVATNEDDDDFGVSFFYNDLISLAYRKEIWLE